MPADSRSPGILADHQRGQVGKSGSPATNRQGNEQLPVDHSAVQGRSTRPANSV